LALISLILYLNKGFKLNVLLQNYIRPSSVSINFHPLIYLLRYISQTCESELAKCAGRTACHISTKSCHNNETYTVYASASTRQMKKRNCRLRLMLFYFQRWAGEGDFIWRNHTSPTR